MVDPCDGYLSRRLTESLKAKDIPYTILSDPHFLTSKPEIERFVNGKKKLGDKLQEHHETAKAFLKMLHGG